MKTTAKPRDCPVCGETFQPRRSFQRFCSPSCQRKGGKAPEWTCEICGKTFRRQRPGNIERPRFCSMTCRDEANRTRPKRLVCKAPRCAVVFEPKTATQAYCSHKCATDDRWRRPANTPPRWSRKTKGEDDCRNCGRPATHLHHIVPRSKSKDGATDVATNGMPLCFDCHRGWHDRRVVITHHRLTDAELEAVVRRTDVGWVTKNYPDEPVAELLTLYELKTGRHLPHGEAEPLARRLERLRAVTA